MLWCLAFAAEVQCSPSIIYIFSKELRSIELEKNMHQVLKFIYAAASVNVLLSVSIRFLVSYH